MPQTVGPDDVRTYLLAAALGVSVVLPLPELVLRAAKAARSAYRNHGDLFVGIVAGNTRRARI